MGHVNAPHLKLLNCVIPFILLFLVRYSHAEYIIAFPEGDYFPHYSNHQEQMTGFLPKLMLEFSEESGIKFSLQPFPIKRYQQLLEQEQIDFILPSNPAWTDNTSGELVFSSAIMKSRSGYVRTPASKGTLIKGVATVRGYTLPPIKPFYKQNTYQESYTVNTHASLEMLKRGHVDTVYAHLDFVKAWLTEHNLSDYLYFELDFGFDDYTYHLATIKHKEIIKAFDAWLIKRQSYIVELMNHYDIGHTSLIENN